MCGCVLPEGGKGKKGGGGRERRKGEGEGGGARGTIEERGRMGGVEEEI